MQVVREWEPKLRKNMLVSVRMKYVIYILYTCGVACFLFQINVYLMLLGLTLPVYNTGEILA